MNSEDYQFSVGQLIEKWQKLIENDREILKFEFNSLRAYDPRRVKIATHPSNRTKNRYQMIFPYDEDFCRIKLDEKLNEHYQSKSDYINASLIRRFLPGEKENFPSQNFIGAQGPTKTTIEDFLRMIVEQKVSTVVMLSKSFEPISQTLSDDHIDYFPEDKNSTLKTEFFSVRTESIYQNFSFVHRHIKIFSQELSIEHDFSHFHYRNFIDKKVPNDFQTILSLAMKFVDETKFQRSILVHCSAGIGRTGSFIALCYLIEDFLKDRLLNVKKLVDTIRFYRPHLVQTEEQYEYLYRCLVEFSLHQPNHQDLGTFIRTIPKSEEELSNDDQIIRNFQNRNKRAESSYFLTTIAAQKHSLLNRDPENVPYDFNIVNVYIGSNSAYINASFVMNIIKSNGFILTQEPVNESLQTFFIMLTQEFKSFIVAVEEMKEGNYTKISFDDNKGVSSRPSRVNSTRNKVGPYFRSHAIQIDQKNMKTKEIFIFEYQGKWSSDHCVPNNLELFIRFIDRSIYHQRKMNSNRLGVVVHDL